MTIKEKNNCFKINNIDDKNEITYKIGNKIISIIAKPEKQQNEHD